MTISIKVSCPMCGQLNNLAKLSQHIEANHIITLPGLDSQFDINEIELILNLNQQSPLSYVCANGSLRTFGSSGARKRKRAKPEQVHIR